LIIDLLIQHFAESSTGIKSLTFSHKPKFAIHPTSKEKFRAHMKFCSAEEREAFVRFIPSKHSIITFENHHPVICRGFISQLPTQLSELEIKTRLTAIISSIRIKLHIDKVNKSNGNAYFTVLKKDVKLFHTIQHNLFNHNINIHFYHPKLSTCTKCYAAHKTFECSHNRKCCYKCGSFDHDSDICTIDAQNGKKCLKCNKSDHFVVRCPQFLNQLNGQVIKTSENSLTLPPPSAFPSISNTSRNSPLSSYNYTNNNGNNNNNMSSEVMSLRQEIIDLKAVNSSLALQLQSINDTLQQLLAVSKNINNNGNNNIVNNNINSNNTNAISETNSIPVSTASSKSSKNTRKSVSTPVSAAADVLTPSQIQDPKRYRPDHNYADANENGFGTKTKPTTLSQNIFNAASTSLSPTPQPESNPSSSSLSSSVTPQ
jgi:hypothetical protein